MKKVYTAATLALLSFSFVSATEVKDQVMMRQAVPVSVVNGIDIGRSSSTIKQLPVERFGVQRSQKALQVMPNIAFPTTGDPVIDAQLKALTLEMNQKIQSIHEEYGMKIRAILKDKKIIGVTPAAGTATMTGSATVNSIGNVSAAAASPVMEGNRVRLEMTDDGETIPGSAGQLEGGVGSYPRVRQPMSGQFIPMQGEGRSMQTIQRSKGFQYSNPFEGLFKKTN